MRLHLFAALLLAPLALGGCDDNPIGSGGAALVGAWSSGPIHFPGMAPNGSTNVSYQEDRRYESDGTVYHSESIIDETTGVHWVIHARTGTWQASDRVLREVTRAYYVADLTQPPREPVLAPIVEPQLSRVNYEVQGTTLVITATCPPNANCIKTLPLHRVPTLF